ncbi:hypothetical protein HZA86_01935 [Candidatus Uhrbacteria bacterium]|nr:hypothetical protein [Candidatus Uhrbacteria bacterium]
MFFSFHHHIRKHWLERYERFYHPRHRFGRWHFLLDTLLATSVVGLILFNGYLFGVKPLLIRPPLDITVRVSPEQVAVGAIAQIEISYSYHGSAPLEKTTIAVQSPRSFEFDHAEPATGFDATTAQWTLPILKPGARGTVTLFGRQWSVNGRQEPLQVTVTGQRKQDAGTLTTTVNGWIETRMPFVQAKTKIPSTIVLGQDTAIELELKNPTDRALEPFHITVTTPEGWSTTNATPTLTQNRWTIDTIEANGSRIFTIHGHYKNLPEAPAFFFSIQRPDNQELLSVRSDTTIADPGLDIRAVADTAGPIEPGQDIPVTITYINRGDFSLENVTIAITPRGVYVDPDRLDSDTGVVSNGVVTWSPEQLNDLKQIVPSQRGVLRLTVATTPTVALVDHSPLDDFSVILQPQAQLRLPILPETPVTWYGSTTGVAVNTTLGMQAIAQYYTADGEQVGRGAFPLRVGRRTTLWTTITLTNTIHDLYAGRVTMTLAPHVQWTNRSRVTTGSPIQWDAATNTLVWKIDRFDAMLGATPRGATASVELAITPSSDQSGQEAPLLTALSATGTDGLTKVNRTVTLPGVTSGSAKTATVDGRVKP